MMIDDAKAREATQMAEEIKQTYTIRIPQQVAVRIEEHAQTQGIPPTTLIQSLVIDKFKSRERIDRETKIASETAVITRIEALRKSFALFERRDTARFDQLRFEIVKTRAAFLYSLDQTLSATVVDQIIEASEQTAREYTAGLAELTESKS